MAVPKFNKGSHFKRAQQHHHSTKDDNDKNNMAAKARSSSFVRSSAVAHPHHLVVEQHEKQQQQVVTVAKQEQEPTIKQQREKLLRHAKRRIGRGLMEEYETEDQSQTFMERQDSNGQLRNTSTSKLEMGEILGMGAFAQVRVVKSFKDEQQQQQQQQQSVLVKADTQQSENEQFVVKMLRPDLFQGTKKDRTIASIASDLVREGAILARLTKHTNILKLVGCTSSGLEGFFCSNDDNDDGNNDDDNNNQQLLVRPDGFVLVLERLSGSLTEKFSEWRHHLKQLQRVRVADIIVKIPHHRHHNNSKDARDEFWIERLDVCKQLADGIEYLHSNRIIHRDLKGDNVGFDYHHPNVVKIFDFNVARKLPPKSSHRHNHNHQDDELFHLTQKVGSRRYMAKEVGMKQQQHGGYNQKVDIYSFGLLAYQILVLPQSDKVFPDIYTVAQHERRVFVEGERPIIPTHHDYIGKNLTKIIQRSWSDRINVRPSAKVLKEFFTTEIDCKKQCIISKQRAAIAASSSAKKVRPTNKMISTSITSTSTSPRLLRVSGGGGGGGTLRFVSRRIWRPIFRGGRRPHDSSPMGDASSSCWSSESTCKGDNNDDKKEESSLLLYNSGGLGADNGIKSKTRYNKQ